MKKLYGFMLVLIVQASGFCSSDVCASSIAHQAFQEKAKLRNFVFNQFEYHFAHTKPLVPLIAYHRAMGLHFLSTAVERQSEAIQGNACKLNEASLGEIVAHQISIEEHLSEIECQLKVVVPKAHHSRRTLFKGVGVSKSELAESIEHQWNRLAKASCKDSCLLNK